MGEPQTIWITLNKVEIFSISSKDFKKHERKLWFDNITQKTERT